MTILITGGASGPGPDPGTPGDRALLTSLTVSSPAGAVDLLAAPWRLLAPVEGLDDVTMDADTEEIADRDGVLVRRTDARAGLTALARNVVARLRLDPRGANAAPGDMADTVQHLRTVLNARLAWPARCRLTATRWDGQVRWCDVDHVPIAGDFAARRARGSHRYVTVRLLAADPFPRSAAAPITWTAAKAVASMLPFYPLVVASSTTIGTANPVKVDGDEDAFPVVTVTGPATSVTVATATGESWTVDQPLSPGETLVVRHGDLALVGDDLQVEGPAGADWFQYLDPASTLFGLRPGTNAVTVTIPGSSDGTTATIAWDHAWRSFV